MKDETMKRFLELVERTGDKVIVTDPAGEHPYVLMSLDQYERLLSPTSSPSRTKEAEPGTLREPGTAPLETKKPRMPLGNKPAVRKDFALWRSQLGQDMGDVPFKHLVKKAVEATPIEMGGEEQFYLEPLE
jgi:hypothetical protein